MRLNGLGAKSQTVTLIRTSLRLWHLLLGVSQYFPLYIKSLHVHIELYFSSLEFYRCGLLLELVVRLLISLSFFNHSIFVLCF